MLVVVSFSPSAPDTEAASVLREVGHPAPVSLRHAAGQFPLFAGPLTSVEGAFLASSESMWCSRRVPGRAPVVLPSCAVQLPHGRVLRTAQLKRSAMMSGSQGEEQRGNQPPTEERTRSSIEVSVGVPVPVQAWDELLKVWMGGSARDKKALGRMASRSPVMELSFPVQLSGKYDQKMAKKFIDDATSRIADKIGMLPPFQLTLGQLDCVPGLYGGWSVVVEAAESADLVCLREQLSLLLPQTGSTTLFATPMESGFVARIELANYRMRAEAYAARERLAAVAAVDVDADVDGSDAVAAPMGAAFLRTAKGTDIKWPVRSVVLSLQTSRATIGGESDRYYRVMALNGVDVQECEREYAELVAALDPPAGGGVKGKGNKTGDTKDVPALDRDELRVLRSVMGDFDSKFAQDKEVSHLCADER